MFIIDRIKMDRFTKSADAKVKLGKDVSDLHNCFKNTIWNMIDCVGNFTVYEMSHWNSSKDRWIRNRTYSNKNRYKRGDIVFVDLGAGNFKFEPSFSHPCIILAEKEFSILVVPCSTKKFGTGYRDIIDAYAGVDGFSKNTGIQVEDYRWISKNRVISSLGRVNSNVLNKIDQHMLKRNPTHRKVSAQLKAEIQKNLDLTKEIEQLKAEIEQLNSELSVLNSECA